jgi:hypothetical protein
VLCFTDVLIAEKDDAVIGVGIADGREVILAQRLGEIDAANLGAAAGKGRNNEAHRPRSSANSSPTAPARQPVLVHFLN